VEGFLFKGDCRWGDGPCTIDAYNKPDGCAVYRRAYSAVVLLSYGWYMVKLCVLRGMKGRSYVEGEEND